MQKDFTNAETAVKESELWICIGTKQIPVLNAEEQLHVKIFEEESLLVETFDHKKLLRVSEMRNAIMNNLELFAALKIALLVFRRSSFRGRRMTKSPTNDLTL